MERISRKTLKKTAKGVFKKHYWFLVFVCLISAVLGTKYQGALNILRGDSSRTLEAVTEAEADPESTTAADTVSTTVGIDGALNAVIEDQTEDYQNKILKDNESKGFSVGILQLGRQRGVLASVVNHVNSGTLFLMGYSAFHNMTGSKSISLILFVVIAFMVYLFFWIFIGGVYEVVMGRIFLESRVYDHIPTGRFIYLIRIKRWVNVSLALFRRTVYEFLWGLTFIGGLIKKYSYFCVPYILAENPNVSGKEAILLSRKMMDGHKWEAFKLELSFILWDLLDGLTINLLGIFFLNPYKSCTYAEYFATLRNAWVAEGKEGSEYFCDRYLYEKADRELLAQTYSDFESLRNIPEEQFSKGHAFARFMAKNFGVILRHDSEEAKYLKTKAIKQRIKLFAQMMDGEVYPNRLSPIPEKEKIKNLEGIGYERCYTIVSLILIFFCVCFVGWVWEVSLHLISDHEFVNRGVLHGPWLPIYGTGGLVILLCLNRFRKNIPLEFILSMVLAGFVEYMTAWHLETTYHQKWWSYTGYFLNLHGRVCAEGLLIFGLGGLAIVYLVAPLLDNQFRKIPKKIALVICAILMVIYVGDSAYSHVHPNTGDGITNYKSENIDHSNKSYISGILGGSDGSYLSGILDSSNGNF